MHHKNDLPTKVCASCGRPFTWRKKWAKNWGEVKYCSKRCASNRNSTVHLEKYHINGSSN